MKKILIPIDEKESVKTMELAKEYASKFGAELVIIHVKRRFEVDGHVPWNFDQVKEPEIRKAVEDYARTTVEKAADYFKDTGIKVTTEILNGHIASEICDYADNNGCDLIMISSHGHGAVERFLIGGVTSRVVHHSNVPVLVVR
tara:strand:- start:26 stop:457 length:432 start_codon:yes stop_codon:yes gene_type:complete